MISIVMEKEYTISDIQKSLPSFLQKAWEDFDRLGIRTKLCLISKSLCRVCVQTLCFLSESGDDFDCYGERIHNLWYPKVFAKLSSESGENGYVCWSLNCGSFCWDWWGISAVSISTVRTEGLRLTSLFGVANDLFLALWQKSLL